MLSIEPALRRAQVIALGGDESWYMRFLEATSEIASNTSEFWTTVIAYCVQYQRFALQQVFVAPGVREERGSERPSFTMRGRSVPALQRGVEAWHGSLARVSLKKKAI